MLTKSLPFLVVFIFSWIIQSTILFSWDVSWGLHEAARLLAGGAYGKDFFEPTPPMFLYVYLPSVLITKYFHISNVIAMRSYLFVLSAVSLSACHFVGKKIFWKEDKEIAQLFLLTIATIFLLLPLPFDFGQREHLLLILIMPYLLLVVAKLEGYACKTSHAVFIGIMAAIGFSIKPFFLMTFVLIECYFMLSRKQIYAFLRAETLAILTVFIVYLVLIAAFYQNYLFQIVPLVTRIYYQGYGFSMVEILKRPEFIFISLTMILSIAQLFNHSYKKLSIVLLLSIVGFIISYLAQHTLWYYHLLPAYSIAILLNVLLLSQFGLQKNTKKIQYFWMTGILIASAAFLYCYARDSWTLLVLEPNYFFSYMAGLLLILFYLFQQQKNYFKIGVSVLITIAVSYRFNTEMSQTSWYPHQFLATLALITLFFILLVSNRRVGKYHAAMTMMIAMMVFAFPFYSASHRYWAALDYKNRALPLIQFMNQNAVNQPIYFLSTVMNYEYPIVEYTHAIPVSKYPLAMWLPGYVKAPGENRQWQQDHNYFIDSIAEELNQKKPKWVFVDANKNKAYLKGIEFDYINNFSQNENFRLAWKAYRYATTLHSEPAYCFNVYQRI